MKQTLTCTILLFVTVFCESIHKVQEVRHHEVLHIPELSQSLKRSSNISSSLNQLSFFAHNRQFHLELEPHDTFIHPDASYQIETGGQWADVQFDKSNYYKGKAKMGGEEGFVSLRLNPNEGYFVGLIVGEKESFAIEHSSHYYFEKQDFPMIIYKASDITTEARCASSDSHQPHSLLQEAQNLKRQAAMGNTCQMSFVADSRVFQALNKNILDTLERMMDIMAATETIYRSQNLVGFQVMFLGIYTNQNTDPFYTTSTDHKTFLNSLNVQKVNIPPANKCVVHALTFYNWAGIVGFGGVGTTCDANGGAGVTSHNTLGKMSSLWSVSNTVAHEIGHNFGCQHDTSGNYLMAAVGGATTIRQFSAVSLAAISNNFALQAKKACLVNKPAGSVGSCGNGYLDAGEQCDCGSSCATDAYCTSSCTLKPGYQCSPNNGKCCSNTGRFLVAGTVCEQAPYAGVSAPNCTGTSPVCPDCFPDNIEHPCNIFGNTSPCNYQPCKVGCVVAGTTNCFPGPSFNPPLAANLPDGTCCPNGKCQNGVCVVQ